MLNVFGCIDQLDTIDGHPLIVEAGPGRTIHELYRARVFQSDDKSADALGRPDLRLGSPPWEHATAGRMNARGISVFYAARQDKVAIAEVRPPVGSRVAVARLDIIRPVRLLDLTAFAKVHETGSIFDPSFGRTLERAYFLRSLVKRMIRPVMPDDEVFDYLATQAVADFLASENNPTVDGIIFPSAQVFDGHNIVLFHKAAGVLPLELPKGTKISVSLADGTEEGYEPNYYVSEKVPAAPTKSDNPENQDMVWPSPFSTTPFGETVNSSEVATLRVDPGSIMVHHVNWVEYNCTPFQVTRHRFSNLEPSDF